ncbi:hypothetical protein PR048_013250, partial [Dryococelus australis]
MVHNASQQKSNGLRASYNISLLIAKSGKPNTIGEELILPAVMKRRIDEMAENVEDTLCSTLKTTECALQLDESTLPGNESLLLAYVRFVKDESLKQEFLFARQLKTDTKGQSIFIVVEEFFQEKEIPLINILTCVTYGAPSMTCCYNGFVAYMKKLVPYIFTIYCVIHRQHLVVKNLSGHLHNSLHTIITALMLSMIDFSGNSVLKMMKTLNIWCFIPNVVEFLKTQMFCSVMSSKKSSMIFIVYLSELFAKFNEINVQLQGNDTTLIKAKFVISALIAKLTLFKRNVGRRQLYQFPTLSELEHTVLGYKVYCDHLGMLHKYMSERFEDLIIMEIPDWVINPFSDTEKVAVLEEELIELQNDIELKPKFKKSYEEFCLQKEIPDHYPVIWRVVKKLLVAFPTSYLVERGFSVINVLLSKQRNPLQITWCDDLRLMLSDFNQTLGNWYPSIKPIHRIK